MGLFCCKFDNDKVVENKYRYSNDKFYTYPIDEPYYRKHPISANIYCDRYRAEYFV
ncbi:putative orfan [Tupanvirus soda lake]|uniref:Orfan n=2 Tax=Tupanvirus TaxID=2094720 RepID=A0AC62ABK0_9VIRU|nr:putative orfan [Tupanvirus soda lake]QKU35082.1 putative orfan [Tupanvirus soda lake]